MNLGFLGPEGSHSHQAALSLMRHWEGTGHRLKPFPSLMALMEALHQGEAASWGVLPLENALEGSVVEVLDALGLQKFNLTPYCDFLFPVVHCLIQAHPGPVTTVISHPMALGQCRESLFRRFGSSVQRVAAPSTSEAVRRLLEPGTEGWAAIGTAAAARLYGLPILTEDVSDTPDNQTRFLVVSGPQAPALPLPPDWVAGKPWRSSLCLGIADRPGALVDLLLCFKAAGLNLSKIESRPSRRRFGEYLFHLDVEGDIEQERQLLAELAEMTVYRHILKPYRSCGRLDEERG